MATQSPDEAHIDTQASEETIPCVPDAGAAAAAGVGTIRAGALETIARAAVSNFYGELLKFPNRYRSYFALTRPEVAANLAIEHKTVDGCVQVGPSRAAQLKDS